MAPCSLPNLTLRIVNTGKPLSSTGECVGVAASHFKGNTLQPEFTAVTEAMAAALEKNDAAAFKQAVKANHRLLLKLGVVPEKVAAFIADIEKTGNSAKICGAGAVTGEQGGVVLIAGDAPIHPVLERYGYGEETTCVDHLGVNRHHG